MGQSLNEAGTPCRKGNKNALSLHEMMRRICQAMSLTKYKERQHSCHQNFMVFQWKGNKCLHGLCAVGENVTPVGVGN